MKYYEKSFFKNAFASASLVLAVGHAPIALAHTQGGSLGSSAGATDLYTVTCSTNAGGATFRLGTRVKNNTPGSVKVSVQARKGSIATNITDATSGDAGYSFWVYNNSGNGAYNVLVDKSATGANNYTLDYHCQTAAGGHTGTSITTNQNQ
ncbi:MAG: hypothetical protein ACHBNF_07810 [Chromatiales bacterium]